MSRKTRRIICCVLVVFAFSAGIIAYAQTQEGKTRRANAVGTRTYLVDSTGKIDFPADPTDPAYREEAMNTRGNSETNPFLILEIVPYEGLAEFGYQISGQEPLDVDAMAQNDLAVPGESVYYNVTDDVLFTYWATDRPATFIATDNGQMRQYGTMTYLPGAGQYTRTVDEEDAEHNVIKATYTASASGDFAWTPLSAEACLALSAGEKSMYETGYQNATSTGESFKMYFDNVDYVQREGKILDHKDTFLRESVGLAYETINGIRTRIPNEADIDAKVAAFHSLVITVTPEDLNVNPELADRADMVIFSSGVKSHSKLTTYGASKTAYLREEKFGYENETAVARGNNVDGATFETNLLNWEVALRLYARATDPIRRSAIIFDTETYNKSVNDNAYAKNVKLHKRLADGTIVEGQEKKGTQSNIAKLYLMMYQMNNTLLEYYYGEVTFDNHQMFSETDMKDAGGNTIVRKGVTLKTGVFDYDKNWATHPASADSEAYWNDLTLYPWQIFPNDPSLNNNNVNDYGRFAAINGIMVDSSDAYQNNLTAGDAQNSIQNGLLRYNGDTKLGTGLDVNCCDVKNNTYGSEVYEFFDSINGPSQGEPPETGAGCLTMADCLYYLLNGLEIPDINNKVYKILELQPSPVYENKDWFWTPFIANYTNSTQVPEVVQMTTSEFIGSHVECISEYDIIYVGMNKSTEDMTMEFKSGTNFAYAHTGPKLEVKDPFRALHGWLTIQKVGMAESYNQEREKYFVFSGNDLTKLALKKLKEYDQAKSPILFGEEFYTNASSKTIANTVDGNSNIYNLGKNVNNAFSMDDILASSAKRGDFKKVMTVNSTKVDLIVYESPKLYDSHDPEDQRYLADDRILRFRFKIDAPAGTSYTYKLYVDSNTDGIFTEGLEDVGATVRRVVGGVPVGHSGPLQVGETYQITREVGDRIGSVAWKLDLIKDGKVYASLDGVSAIKIKPGETPVTIKVLQIEPKAATDSLKLPKNQSEADSMGGASKLFYDKIKNINGMTITFDRMSEDAILPLIDPAQGGNPDYLYNNYNMLVLGFSDTYDGVSDTKLLDAIQQFIANGSAVLYTHDTSSGIGDNYTTDFPRWGEQVTLRYRDMFGMDRYGALGLVANGVITAGKDIPYKPVDGSPQTSSIYKSNHDNRNLVQGVANGMLYRTLYPSDTAKYPKSDQDANVNTTKVSRVNMGAITQYPYTIDKTITVATTHPQYYQLDMERDDLIVWYCLADDNSSQGYEKKYFSVTPNDVRNNYYIYNMGNITYSGMGHLPYFTSELDMEVSVAEIELFVNTFVAAYRAAAKGVTVEVLNDDATSAINGDQYLCVDVDSSKPDEIIGNDIVDKARKQVKDSLVDVYKQSYRPGDESIAAEQSINKKSKRVYFRLKNNNTYGGEWYDIKIEWNNGAEANGITIDGDSTMLAVYRAIDANGDGVYEAERFVTNKDVTGAERYLAADDCVYFVDVPIVVQSTVYGDAVAKTDLKITVTMWYTIGQMSFDKQETTNVYILPRGLFDLD